MTASDRLTPPPETPGPRIPTAAELDAHFMVSNSDGKRCEVISAPTGEPVCTRDAVYRVTLVYPDTHACGNRTAECALCLEHTEGIQRYDKYNLLVCKACRASVTKLIIEPLGGRA
jgi:hypothetical protein